MNEVKSLMRRCQGTLILATGRPVDLLTVRHDFCPLVATKPARRRRGPGSGWHPGTRVNRWISSPTACTRSRIDADARMMNRAFGRGRRPWPGLRPMHTLVSYEAGW